MMTTGAVDWTAPKPLGLEQARKVYAETMDNLKGAAPEHAAAVTHAVLGLVAEERADAARASAEEADRLRVQLAGCLVAAEGGTNPERVQVAVEGDYGWSKSYQAVLDLRRSYDALKDKIAALECEIRAVKGEGR